MIDFTTAPPLLRGEIRVAGAICIATGVADAAGHSAELDGANLQPLLTGGAAPAARSLYWHYPHEHDLVSYGIVSAKPFAAIRSGSHKLILDFASDSVVLFDLSADPGESTDLAGGDPLTAGSLRAELTAWLNAVGASMP